MRFWPFHRNRPVIGITTSNRSGWRIYPLIALSVLLAGGKSKWWRVGHEADINDVDALIVGGGDDISADLYGGRFVPESRIDPERDKLEKGLVEQAKASGRPVLGICRGSQMINIALGGTLHQDIYEVYEDAKRMWTILPKKRVDVQPNTRLGRITGEAPMKVNCLHTQSVAMVGQDLRIAARDEADVIQSVELTGEQFMLGVQWHPEHLFYARRQRAIFRALVAAARAWRGGRHQNRAVDRAASRDKL
ncbi:gamma-glutamyl-gamma-aminobutyrate hydrolase family protein [Paracoccaceae bacterium GXU_MW_L88]